MPDAPITRAVAAFAAGLNYADLPPSVVEQAKRLWIDSIGVMLAGSREPLGAVLAGHVRDHRADGPCAVAGHRLRTAAPLAALANGAMAHALDYDDICITWLGHPSAVLVPSVLALGTELGASGERAIAAYVAGWEAGAAVGRSIRHRVHEAGWHSTSVTGTIGATAAAANLRGLDVETTRVALGIGASLAAGMYANRGTDTKPFHAGNAARAGITAADLAARGLGATAGIFDGPGNFAETLIAERAEPQRMLEGLGTSWDILSPGATLKLHACCGASHYCLDALLELVLRHDIRPERVDLVECHVPPGVPSILIYHDPKDGLEAKFSLEYSIAAAVLDRRAGISQFTDAAVGRPEARDLMRRVRYVHPAGMEDSTREIVAQPHRVVVRLRSGEMYENSNRYFRGRAENPLDREELVSKFRDCAAGSLTAPAIDALLESLEALERLPAVGAIGDLVA